VFQCFELVWIDQTGIMIYFLIWTENWPSTQLCGWTESAERF